MSENKLRRIFRKNLLKKGRKAQSALVGERFDGRYGEREEAGPCFLLTCFVKLPVEACAITSGGQRIAVDKNGRGRLAQTLVQSYS